MAQLCLLHGMLLLSSLVCQDIANIWAGAEILELRNTSTDSFVSPDTPPVLCGRRPEMRKPINASDVDDGLEKIIGGRLARHGQYPWTVNIRARTVNNGVVTYGQVCGGAIINEYWVLTAAHCKRVGNETSLSIVVGDFDRQIKDEGEQKFLVDKFIPHQRYTGKGVVDYNIALIKVANTSDGRGIRFNDYVQPICLPNPGQKCLLDDFLVVTGWGAECATHKTRSIRHLKSVHLRCKTKKFCRRNIYSRLQITDRMFCAGAKYSEQDVCDGDLGGPGALRRASKYSEQDVCDGDLGGPGALRRASKYSEQDVCDGDLGGPGALRRASKYSEQDVCDGDLGGPGALRRASKYSEQDVCDGDLGGPGALRRASKYSEQDVCDGDLGGPGALRRASKYSEQDVCDGDLGGPGALRRGSKYSDFIHSLRAVEETTEDLFILIGVMSHGTLCQKRNFPVIFSSVSAYLPWIEKTIANYSNFGEGTIPGRRVKLTEATLSTTNETLLE